mgnify:CR=1 FL=1
MRIVTWNVNSIGARIDRVLAWVEANQPDVLALQELKCTSEAFPSAERRTSTCGGSDGPIVLRMSYVIWQSAEASPRIREVSGRICRFRATVSEGPSNT